MPGRQSRCQCAPLQGRLVTRPGASIPRFSRVRRMAAVLTVFVASGLVHEVLFWWVGLWWARVGGCPLCMGQGLTTLLTVIR